MANLTLCRKFLLILDVFLFLTTSLKSYGQHQDLLNRLDSISTANGENCITLCTHELGNPAVTDELKGYIHRIRGKAFYFLGDYKQAGSDYDTSVTILSHVKNDLALAVTWIDQARLYRKLKMYAQAIDTYSNAKNVFEQRNDKNNLATVLNEWGVVYEMQEQYDTAESFYKKALHLKEQLKDTIGIAFSNGFLANLYVLSGQLNLAESYSKKALLLFQLTRNPFNIALQSTDLAVLYRKQKKYVEAIALLKSSDSFAIATNKPELAMQVYAELSGIYAALNNYKDAYIFHQKYATLKDSLFTASSQKTIAELDVRYQTLQKNKQIIQQRSRISRQRWLILSSIVLLAGIISASIFIYKNRKLREQQLLDEARHRQDLLRLEAEQAVQQDRLRISRDLHDNIGSYLTCIKAGIGQLAVHEPEVLSLQQLTDEGITELRRTVWLINRPSITLEEWIIKLREYYSKFNNIDIRTKVTDDTLNLSAMQATGLYRIVQEAVSNAMKYAEASSVSLQIEENSPEIKVIIQDNGNGFDMQMVKKGFGLQNMQVRAEELNGSCRIKSSIGKGTVVEVTLPFITT